MYTIAAKMMAKPGKRAEFICFARECVLLSKKEDGCLSYTLFLQDDNPNAIFFYEEYTDKASFKAHLKTEHFKKFSEDILQIREGETELHRFEN